VSEDAPPGHALELANDLSMALLVVPERLSPEERAAFLMYDAFDCEYSEIASALGKSEAACRQLVHRARLRVRNDKRRFEVPEAAHRSLVRRYVKAVHARDPHAIASLLAPDAVFLSDGGGKAWAALQPIVGAHRIARLETGVVGKLPGRLSMTIANINGRAGVIGFLDRRVYAATSFDTDGRNILSVMRILNPDKLVRLSNLTADKSGAA
jgi:RNA polymerase sigma-70 factor (ECF subfamily)